MSDEYDVVARGKLKLKSDSKISKKKKKEKKKREKLERELNKKTNTCKYEEDKVPKAPERKLTKAELSFKKMQEKMVNIFYQILLNSFI